MRIRSPSGRHPGVLRSLRTFSLCAGAAEPCGSFLVRFTPPRPGTFIYHTHLHDYRQLSSGLYGPLIVVDGDETFDPATDHVIVLGRPRKGVS